MTRNYSNMGWFIVSIILATLLATVVTVAGSYTFVGFGRFVYNVMTVVLSAAIPTITALYQGI